ncbi:helix-turn-helix transcriptional regulator [Paludibacterium purpuratum]|uniref:DNA-binding XRE family transcriptional regulator n=1 Tax=Paludibacterium purpuratum TaxID=1144873 RepID=A0A4R7B0N0_9NEIS|nr:helix-turn-helix domain-containing protein [Paludibacterium purpuratum]TDR76476.1 DNA-binding XRE family transcriptional regulator [Paludibacterium purpuratum]
MKNLSPIERENRLAELLTQLMSGTITEGKLLRTLRKEVLGLSQEQYSKLVGISRRTLSDLELDRASPSLALLNASLRPLGLQVGILPRDPSLRRRLFEQRDTVPPSN